MYIEDSIKKYVDDLSAKLPAPGGGSAAALTGTLGVSLILMVLNYTIGKEKYKKFEEELMEAQKSAKGLKKKLSVLVDRDVEAYKKVSATFSSQDGTIKEKTLKDAAGVPIEICNCSYEAMKLCRKIMDKTNKNLISDVAVAAEFLEAAYNSALFNIKINLKDIKDREFSGNIEKVIEPQIEEVEELKEAILEFVNKNIT
ncbi:MAG: cyclodeaminase/cyclohydrolase family protein [Candidatus Omnitrophica bacterium]|nr:cyclodeaminase/cyclohydrolase family protein [Candidatus Omnitrophota bacterium]